MLINTGFRASRPPSQPGRSPRLLERSPIDSNRQFSDATKARILGGGRAAPYRYLSARAGCASRRPGVLPSPGQQQQRLVGVATAAAAVTGRCGSCAAAICARWLRRLGAQRPRCLRGTADSVGAIGGSIAPRRAGRPAAREGSSNRGSRKFAGNRRERGCERPEGVGVVAGGALNGTWRPQGGRAASPRPRGSQAALSRQLAGPQTTHHAFSKK